MPDNVASFLPEVLLLSIALLTLLLGVFGFANSAKLPIFSAILLSSLSGFMLIYDSGSITWLKILLLMFAVLALYLRQFSYTEQSFEYIPLLLFSCLAGFIIISAKDFLSLFMGLELQSLAAYILTGVLGKVSHNDKQSYYISAEAGIKYFSLGAISSCLMLFGISLIYGINHSIGYSSLPVGKLESLAMILILLSFLFKLAAAPMQMWLPDVYQGSSIFSLNIFISVNKLSALIGLNNLLIHVFNQPGLLIIIDKLLIASMILSLFVGGFGALMQDNFKRFIAYSSIFDIAYVLLSLLCRNYQLSVVYLLIYTINLLALISAITYAKLDHDKLELKGFTGLLKSRRFAGVGVIFCLFSLMGMPPLLGFIGKYYVIVDAFANGYNLLAFGFIVITLASSYYYLRVIKFISLAGQ